MTACADLLKYRKSTRKMGSLYFLLQKGDAFIARGGINRKNRALHAESVVITTEGFKYLSLDKNFKIRESFFQRKKIF